MDFKTLPYNDSKYDSIISQKASEEPQVKNLSINPEEALVIYDDKSRKKEYLEKL